MNTNLIPLAELKKHQQGIIRLIDTSLLKRQTDLNPQELTQRLLEIGIIEGTKVKVMHFGLIKKDPICIFLEEQGINLAIRKNESQTILVELTV